MITPEQKALILEDIAHKIERDKSYIEEEQKFVNKWTESLAKSKEYIRQATERKEMWESLKSWIESQ